MIPKQETIKSSLLDTVINFGVQVLRTFHCIIHHFLLSVWELRDKRSFINLQFLPESLGAMLEY